MADTTTATTTAPTTSAMAPTTAATVDAEAAKKKLLKARAALVMEHPFIAAIALPLRLVADPTCDTGWTDGTSLGYNPAWVAGLHHDEATFFVAHETFHVVFAHHLRRGDRDRKLWNVAGDHVINLALKLDGFRLTPGALCDQQFDGLATEEVYRRLQGRPGDVDDGSPCGQVRDAPAPNGGAKPSEAELRAMEADLKARVTQARNQERALRGTGTDATERAADACRRPRVDWRAALRRFAATVRTRDDYSWRRPNPRYLGRGLYLPALESESLGELVVALDTSGSIYGVPDLVDQFRSELDALLAEHPNSKLHLVHCDSGIRHTEEVTATDLPLELTARGGGGTSFTPPFEWVEEQNLHPAGLIYFTDLAGPFPEHEPPYPVLWLDYGPYAVEAPFGETVTARAD